MVDITLIELNVEDGSFTAGLPFGSSPEEDTETETEREEEEAAGADGDDGGGSKGLVLLGVLVFLIIATAVVKYLTGGDSEEAEDEPPAATA